MWFDTTGGSNKLIMTNEERWVVFIDELRAYVEEYHHFPNKHTSMLNAIKYTRKKIREGTLEERKVEQFREIEGMRWMEEHTGGRRKVEGL